MGGDSLEMCVGGSPVDSDSVCIEHGETACVITAGPERAIGVSGAISEDLGRRLRLAQALRHATTDR